MVMKVYKRVTVLKIKFLKYFSLRKANLNIVGLQINIFMFKDFHVQRYQNKDGQLNLPACELVFGQPVCGGCVR